MIVQPSHDLPHLKAAGPHSKHINTRSCFLNGFLKSLENFYLKPLITQVRDLPYLISLASSEKSVEFQKLEVLEKQPMPLMMICNMFITFLP